MRKLHLGVVCLPFLAVSLGVMADDQARESEIHRVVERLSEAWRAGDGSAWADEFAEDADFTAWFGLRLKGKKEIAFGHQMIFDNFYADTTFDLSVQNIRFVRDDVAIALLVGSVARDGEAIPEEPDAVPLVVLEQRGDDWKIIAFQNTPFAVNEFRTNGDIKRLKELAAQERISN